MTARARLVAQWAVTCWRGGLVPLVECVVRIPAHHGLAETGHTHSAALATVVAALRAAGADPASTVLGVSLVLPGRRSSQVAGSEDVARATVRSLRSG